MAKICGTYSYVKSDNLEEYLSKIFGPAAVEAAREFEKEQPTLHITHRENKYLFELYNSKKKYFNTIYLGAESEELFFDVTVKTIVTMKADNKLYFVSRLDDGNSLLREYVFSREGIIVYYADEKHGIKATSYYDKISDN